ncbi:tryptophan 2,3-dioxygenase [Pseudoalteromonas nigrifaciens]|uniref:tryptophan 2,3-dioxygenase n=1 Tax=Pseudoalteromonas nigrifaciens TaxID=28109 RepID=UPI0017882C43|nr:tryptophan 2,3-dioxygenase family protein [Pseudoalteromonas nigrifaciens]MBE0420540.1 tryptophan 2,3-dioxygenase [Pseudoalteromonas nigrifaciens]
MSCPNQSNYYAMDDSIHTNFKENISYGDYLCLEKILSAQQPCSEQHDEMLFVIVHQASELWLKLASHELIALIKNVKDRHFDYAFKVISRVKQIVRQLTQSWDILSTLTPVDYMKFRDNLGRSSGIQSYGYRKIEFLLGNKNTSLLAVYESNESVHSELCDILKQPSLYDEVISSLHTRGLKIDTEVLHRDVTLPYQSHDSVLNAWLTVYQNHDQYFEFYELAEKLLDIEELIQQWRFKHMSTVMRVIGNKKGTGGSSGVNFLKKAMDISFFPELYTVRTLL